MGRVIRFSLCFLIIFFIVWDSADWGSGFLVGFFSLSERDGTWLGLLLLMLLSLLFLFFSFSLSCLSVAGAETDIKVEKPDRRAF